MIRYRKTDQGLELFFKYDSDVDKFIRFLEAMQEPVHDPDDAKATARLLEGLKWGDAHDPYGATLGGLCVRAFRHEIHQRARSEPQRELVLPLINHGDRIEDQRGVSVGTVDLVALVNRLTQDDPRGFDL